MKDYLDVLLGLYVLIMCVGIPAVLAARGYFDGPR
jgi:hypothetical protein